VELPHWGLSANYAGDVEGELVCILSEIQKVLTNALSKVDKDHI
jgi:hypothetical protein